MDCANCVNEDCDNCMGHEEMMNDPSYRASFDDFFATEHGYVMGEYSITSEEVFDNFRGSSDYLTEAKLGDILNDVYDVDDWVRDKVAIKGTRYRPDYRSDKLKLIVEFDGYQHFTNPDVIFRDMEKVKLYSENGYTVVSVPYFVQLTPYNLMDFLPGSDPSKLKPLKFPTGFVSDKAYLPASFCSAGLGRYKAILDKLDFIDYMNVHNSLLYHNTHLGKDGMVVWSNPSSVKKVELDEGGIYVDEYDN